MPTDIVHAQIKADWTGICASCRRHFGTCQWQNSVGEVVE
jgi:hypothetical protein